MRMSGLEPMTPCMSSRYSNQLSYTLTTESIIAHFLPFVNPYFEKIGKFLLRLQNGNRNSIRTECIHPQCMIFTICNSALIIKDV